jgi:hypothetical protein
MATEDEVLKLAKQSGDIERLLAAASEDPQLAIQLLKDPAAVIEKSGLLIDANSEEYKELTLRLYHAKILLDKVMLDLRN